MTGVVCFVGNNINSHVCMYCTCPFYFCQCRAGQHIPSKVNYSLHEVIGDLMRYGASSLRLGRRLVFWMPVYRQDFLRALQQEQISDDAGDTDRLNDGSRNITSSAFPYHSCLQLVAACEQRLTSHSSRILLTYEKVSFYYYYY